MIIIKNADELAAMRISAKKTATILHKVAAKVAPGVTTAELDEYAAELARKEEGRCAFYGYHGFSGRICCSINEEVVHGIPSADVVLREGDVLSIDFGIRLGGYCGDSAVTVPVGEISAERRRLMDTTREVLELAIATCAPSVKWSYVAGKMQEYTEAAGFSVVKDFVGHGIGKEMHEEPRVPNFVSRDLLANDFVLERGMVLAVKPMVNAGGDDVRTLKNGWTVVTRDSSCSAHFEHTIAIVDQGCEILTRK